MLSFAARVLSDPEAFISYVGADNKIADPVLEDPSGLNRSRVSIITRRGTIPREGPHLLASCISVVVTHEISLDDLFF